MDVFVVLATHGREQLLERTLVSLAQCRMPDGFRGTLIVENGKVGDAERIVERAAPALAARYLFETAANKSRALNTALVHIEGGLIVFLDDDVRVAPDLIERYVSAARSAGPGHFFGGPVAADYEEHPPDWLLRFLPTSAQGWSPDSPQEAGSTPFFLGFNWAASADDIRRAGGFSEAFGPGSTTGSIGQESEMQRRLTQAGVTATYVPGALVYHWVPRDRCSPQFALERAFRNGIRLGLLKQHDIGPVVAGYPIVHVKRTLEYWLRSHMPRSRADHVTRFGDAMAYQQQRGVLQGLLLKNRAAGKI